MEGAGVGGRSTLSLLVVDELVVAVVVEERRELQSDWMRLPFDLLRGRS